MFNKKYAAVIMIVILASFSLLLAACGESSATPTASAVNAPATTPTVAATTAVTTAAAATTAAPVATTAPATTAATTPAAKSPAATTPDANKRAAVAEKATPDMIAKKFYTDVQSGDVKNADAALLSQSLRKSLLGKGNKGMADEAIYKLVGVSKDQKIDTFTLDTPVINGDKATLNVTVKLADGTSLKQTVSMVKGEMNKKSPKGTEISLWQIDNIVVG